MFIICRNELIPILTVINHSLSFLVSQSGKVNCIQTLFNDECLLKLLQCIHTSMFSLSSHQMELLQQNNDEFYWDYVECAEDWFIYRHILFIDRLLFLSMRL